MNQSAPALPLILTFSPAAKTAAKEKESLACKPLSLNELPPEK
jgi:hypothetical protein